jgi:hypothetical protein
MVTRVSAHPSFVFVGWAKFSAAPPLHSALVMTEMGNRVLARSIAQSSVVLVGRPQPQQMLGRLAASQGHEVVSITRSLKERLGGLSRDWVLLLFVDAGGNEAPVLSATLQALGRATVTYIVMRFQPRAVTKLFEKGYKVMMLSCTDLIPHFPPNALITRDNVAMLNNASQVGRGMRTSLPPRSLTLPSHRGKAGTTAGAILMSQTSANRVRRVLYLHGTPVQRTYLSEPLATQLHGSLMKTHNWPRPHARLFAVNEVSLLRSAARHACSFPPRCELLKLRYAANPRIVPSPSDRICCCCSSTRFLAASSEDLYHGCRDFYLHWGTTPSRNMLRWATTAVPTRPPCTAAGLSARGRI